MQELQGGDPLRTGPYRMVGRLGAGGMGMVFAGRSADGRLVAVKVIRGDWPGIRSAGYGSPARWLPPGA